MRGTAAWLRVAPAVFLLAWGGNHFTPLIHLYEDLGHYAPWQANLLLGLYVLGLVPGLLVSAAVSDSHGRKPVLLGGLVASILGSVLLGCGLHAFALLCAGRALAGVGVGVAMSVGTSWIKELSSPPHDPLPPRGAGARRPSLTLTLGFGVGAAVTGALAQWGPEPARLPYGLHVLLSLAALVLLLAAPETLGAARRAAGPWWQDLRVPAAGHRRFVGLVVPAAPWIFGAAGVAYAVMPAVAAPRLGDATTGYATLLTVLTLGCGAIVQPFVARLEARSGGRALPVGMLLMTAGTALAAVASLAGEPLLALGVAVVLGCGYGVTVVAGLAHVQAIATPHDLAGLTGVYYSLAYTGFLLPTVLAALLPVAPYPASLAVVALACAGCLALVARRAGRFRGETR
ncbi:MFS transporter [Puerhibacterium puerhi]|uniref:MFS transporter n=1 Tax=Puerhibacterium puerhi TaxID=2692623 RepID=UPI001F23D0FF|nr:MFS transporter [Puerhibacterium puerhi]